MRLGQLVPAPLILAAMFSVFGCSTLSTPVVAPGNYGNVSGNWLVSGSMPQNPFTVGAGAGAIGTVFLSVAGSQIDGYLFLSQLPCESSPGLNSPVPLTGTVDYGGAFTLTTPHTPNGAQSAIVQGIVPSTTSGLWKGTYTFNYLETACSVPATNFEATAIAPVTGAYSGTSFLSNGQPYAPQTPVPIIVSLQQGNYLPRLDLDSGYVQMSGTISLTNSPCLTSGTLSNDPTLLSGLVGASFSLYFQMNDGSIVEIVGTINNQDSSVLSVIPATTTVGTCGQVLSSPPPPTNWVTLSR